MVKQSEYEINKELRKLRRLENLTIWGISAVAFLSPLLIQQHVLSLWAILSPFFVGLLIHHYIYVPVFLLKGNYFTYFFLLFVLLLGIVFGCEAIIDIMDVKYGATWTNYIPYESTLLSNFVIALLLMGMNVAVRMVFNNIKSKMLAHEADNKLIKYKMEFLQFQISPHFLMNTLNNIHVLVDTDEEKAKDAIVSLSRLLRHMLYESTPDTKISFERQLEVFRAYCNLNLLRYGENVKLNITVPRDIPNVQLPPLIMIVFIENAFKHGIVYGEETHINMNFWVEPGWFHFSLSNTIFPDKPKTTKQGGLGIKNVKERLNLLYGNNYKLTMEQTQSEYIVHLQLPL
ncbi:MAG: histidine kinase [Bacteroidales bacterium]|jgi:sensor histidine kinase YesM